MPLSLRYALLSLLTLAPLNLAGCNMVPRQAWVQSQLTARQYYNQSVQLASERDALAAQASSLEQALQMANSRLDNLNAERAEMQQRYISLLRRGDVQSPLSEEATRRFQDLAKKYPEFEFDPQTGVSKFHSDILFASGSADIKSSASPLLREFAEILNAGEARKLHILVVGHTDDKPIAHAATRAKHPTNWHLSTNRANSVVLELAKIGMSQDRMGVAGYSMFQPVVPNTDEQARQRNRRVEIFVLAPDAVVAGWDPKSSRN